MLGRDLVTLLGQEGEDITGYARGEFDITDATAVYEVLGDHKPAVVVNCAA
jgi:dTDP-4-dehydrorhamnose reductase